MKPFPKHLKKKDVPGPKRARNGPETRFFFKDPTVIWEKGNLSALGSAGASLLLAEISKVYVPFGQNDILKPKKSTLKKSHYMRSCKKNCFSFIPEISDAFEN